jgi:hypothetical protein
MPGDPENTQSKENNFVTYAIEGSRTEDTIVVYATNPGPANALFPLAKKLNTEEGLSIQLHTGGKAIEKAQHVFGSSLKPLIKNTNYKNIRALVTCGHIDISQTVESIEKFKKNNQDTKIVAIDDNLDTVIPLVRELIKRNIEPSFIYLMNPKSIDTVKQLTQKKGYLQTNIEIINNPSFAPYYEDNIDWFALRERFRKRIDVGLEAKILAYYGPCSDDYPHSFDGRSHNAVMFDTLKSALELVKEPITFLYRPHTRDIDELPEQFKTIQNPLVRILFYERPWWRKNNIPLSESLAACDIILSTNSTIQAELFTAHGLKIHPMAVPIDVTFPSMFPALLLNTSLRQYNLVHSLSQPDDVIEELPHILRNPNKYLTLNPSEKLKLLSWTQNPQQIVQTAIASIS